MKQLVAIACLTGLLTVNVSADSEAKYVGRDACTECHQQQVKQWTGSHHDLAMQHASEGTVLADFSGVKFSHGGLISSFYRKGDKYMVTTDGPDGSLHDYQVKYTFGITPLQQYLVELDNGRLQALTIAWDTRPQAAGGRLG